MRKTFGYALCFFLVSSCSSLPVAAQFIPTSPQPVPTVVQAMPSGVQLRDTLTNAQKGGFGPLADYSSTLANAERASKLFDAIQRSKIAVEALPTVPSPEHAHILTWQASPYFDPKIIREIPKDLASNMPMFPAMPPPSQDLRGIFTPPRLPSSSGKPEKLPLY
ncbi:MAG TPA: hypothetical protein VGI46_00730 [Candidatus Acidoferrum sp.]